MVQGEERDPFLTDAELILGVSRHLGRYAVGPAHAALGELEFAGRVFEMAWRLRGSGLSPITRVEAIGLEAGTPPRLLLGDVLPALDSLNWVELTRNEEGEIVVVDEHIPPTNQLIRAADTVLDISAPTPIERAALVLMRETSRMPLTLDAATDVAVRDASEQEVDQAFRALAAVSLIRVVRADDGREVAFNPFIWQGEEEIVAAALRTEDARARQEIGALIEEIADRPGMPQDHVTATEPRWIEFAVAQGLVQRSLVITESGEERAFLFTPHLSRDPFGASAGDPSGHVRQLVGSMIYAATFARYRLYDPRRFVEVMLQYGEAGDASPIGTDYTMLETAGIVRVEPAYRHSKMVLLQPEVAEEALGYLESGGGSGTGEQATSGLRAQRAYIHVEGERAKLADIASRSDADTVRLVSALRDSVGRRRFRGTR